MLEWAWIESLSRLSTAASEEGPVTMGEIFSEVGKLLNDCLNTHFMATQVELVSFPIRSVSFYNYRSKLDINNALISMTKRQATVPNIRSCFSLQRWLWRHGRCWAPSFVVVCPAHMARQFKIPPLSEDDGKIQSPRCRATKVPCWDQSHQTPLAKGCWLRASKTHGFSQH